jgi:Protein phosphatase 2C
MSWKAIARSSKGTSHKKLEICCQDYGNYKTIKTDLIIGAVADGAGSAKNSDLGAELAVTKIIQHLKKRFEKRTNFPNDEQEVKKIFAESLEKVLKDLNNEAKNKNFSVDDLACTLLAVVSKPEWFAAMQIGDGFVVIRSKEEEKYEILFPPDKGEYINETTFVTSSNALNAMRVEVRSQPIEFICAATDGLERVAIDMKDWTPFSPFFQPLDKYMKETSDLETEDEIKNFLDSDRLNARTDDDKTLLLCFYSS